MTIDKQALREAAERATKGPWKVFSDIDTKTFAIHTPRDKRCENVIKWGGFDCQPNAEANAEFIAAFNPKVALALLDENIQLQREKDAIEAVALALRDDMRDAREQLAAAERSIAELERSEKQLINERDSAESALNDAYKAVMGQAPEWSNWFSFENAIDEIELACELWRNQTDDVIQFRQHIANLEAQKADLMRHVLNAYEASALTMTLRKTVGYLPDYLRFCGIYGVDHEAIIDKLDYQSFVLARVNNEDLRQDEAGRYSKCEPPCGDDVAGQDAWFDAAENEGE
ncbi:TPA: ead/Ea22-like family protein [Salmonella enterica subsp. enterica serovar Welikade]